MAVKTLSTLSISSMGAGTSGGATTNKSEWTAINFSTSVASDTGGGAATEVYTLEYSLDGGTTWATLTTTTASTTSGTVVNFNNINVSGIAGFQTLNGANVLFRVDVNGNGSQIKTATTTAAFDVVAPTAPTINNVTDDVGTVTGTVAAGGSSNDSTPTVRISVSGTGAVAGDTVTLLVGGATVGTAVLSATNLTNGYVDITSSALTGDGTKTLTATITDAGGNSPVSVARTFVLDTTAPTAPTIASVTDDVGTVTGAVAAGGVSNDTTPIVQVTLTGTGAVAGDTVTLLVGGVASGTAVLSATNITNGFVNVTSSALTGDGAKTLTVTIRDVAGNVSAASAARTFVLDTTAPTAPTINSVTDDFGTVTGTVAAGGVSNDTTPTVRISVSGTNAASGDTVTLLVGGVSVGSVVLSGTNITNGFVDITSSALSGDGSKSLTATITDAAGNASAASGVRSFVLDTTAPAAPSITGVTDDVGTVTGSVAAGGASNDTTPTVQVSLASTGAVAGNTVTLLSGGVSVGTAVLTATDITNGSVSVTSSALSGDGTKSLTATVTDAVGNVSTASTARNFVLDTTADGSVVASALSDLAATGNGDATLTGNEASGLKVQVGGIDSDATAVTLNFTYNGQSISKALTATAGSFNTIHTVDLSGFAAGPSGSMTMSVTMTDAAGNTITRPNSGNSFTAAICFYPGTRIATPTGERPVEELRRGDLVLTAAGVAAPVRWMGRQTIATAFADPARSLPIRIRAGALGEGLPRRDLLVSPGHALLVDGVLITAAALVNGVSIVIERDVPEVFTYHHVELADQSLVLAEGAPAETFLDNAARESFDNWEEHAALDDGIAVSELMLPRATSARQVPAATQRRLAALAVELAGLVPVAA